MSVFCVYYFETILDTLAARSTFGHSKLTIQINNIGTKKLTIQINNIGTKKSSTDTLFTCFFFSTVPTTVKIILSLCRNARSINASWQKWKKVLNCNFPVDRWMVEEKVLHLLLSKKRKRQDFCGGFHTLKFLSKVIYTVKF